MPKGRVVKFRCPKCGGLEVRKAKIPGIKAYQCPNCNHMNLLCGFTRIEIRNGN